MESIKTHYVLNGFSEEQGFRVFMFDSISADRVHMVRRPFTVRIDMALARKHGIRLQELPLLCRSILERDNADQEQQAFTYTEEDMRLHVDRIAAREEAARLNRAPRRSSNPNVQ